MSNDGLFTLVALAGAIAGGQSNAGNRTDGKLCAAAAGECRSNNRYYSMGMRDAKSWSMPCADNSCPARCPYLRSSPVEVKPEEERRAVAFGLINGVNRKIETDRMIGALALGAMGIDPRTIMDND